MYILIGFAITGLGFLVVVKSEWMLRNFGRIGWFDQHLGLNGGSRLGYKLVGVFIIFIGFLVFTDMIGGFLSWVMSPLTKFNK